jgi:ribonuclease VapC
MIAVDTSALMAILLNEKEGKGCERILDRETQLIISAATLTEALVVSHGRKLSEAMRTLIEGLHFDVIPVTSDIAYRVGDVYRQWGRGHHPANLNFGDCFSYDTAKINDCALLFVGDDFRKTDIRAAL